MSQVRAANTAADEILDDGTDINALHRGRCLRRIQYRCQDLSDDATTNRAADGIASFAHAQILERAACCRPANRAGNQLDDQIG